MEFFAILLIGNVKKKIEGKKEGKMLFAEFKKNAEIAFDDIFDCIAFENEFTDATARLYSITIKGKDVFIKLCREKCTKKTRYAEEKILMDKEEFLKYILLESSKVFHAALIRQKLMNDLEPNKVDSTLDKIININIALKSVTDDFVNIKPHIIVKFIDKNI